MTLLSLEHIFIGSRLDDSVLLSFVRDEENEIEQEEQEVGLLTHKQEGHILGIFLLTTVNVFPFLFSFIAHSFPLPISTFSYCQIFPYPLDSEKTLNAVVFNRDLSYEEKQSAVVEYFTNQKIFPWVPGESEDDEFFLELLRESELIRFFEMRPKVFAFFLILHSCIALPPSHNSLIF